MALPGVGERLENAPARNLLHKRVYKGLTMQFQGIITGYPRSRTYWFSKLLSFGEYHCFHDYWAYYYDIPKGKILLNSSCWPAFITTDRVVIIERDKEEAKASFLRFVQEPFPMADQVFDHIEKTLETVQGLRVPYNRVDEEMDKILDWLGITLPDGRLEEYTGMNLQSPDNKTGKSPYPVRFA